MRVYEKLGVPVVGSPTVQLAVLAVLAATVLTGAVISEFSEEAELELISTGVISEIEGEADLSLSIEGGQAEFNADASVEGDGLIEGVFYSMWLADLLGNEFFLDAVEAEEVCVFDFVTGEEDCEVLVELESELELAPLDITSLEGLTIFIREHFFRRGCGGDAPVVLIGTVAFADLESELAL